MYSLILEYNKEQGNNLSMAAEVLWILQKPGLKPQDIEKRDDCVTKLQVFLDRMAQLIEEHTTIFRIDPRKTMTLALQGCASCSQLEVTYKILVKRLLVVQQTIMKYESQYRQLKAPLSPLSTVPELYGEFNSVFKSS